MIKILDQIAIEASIQAVRAFIQMRTILMLYQDLAERIEELERTTGKRDEKFKGRFASSDSNFERQKKKDAANRIYR